MPESILQSPDNTISPMFIASPLDEKPSNNLLSIEEGNEECNDKSRLCCGPVGKFYQKHFPAGLVPHGGFLGACFTLSSATLGAGTLSIPSATYAAGGISTFVLFCIICFFTIYSIRLLVITLEITGLGTYEQLSNKLVGKWFERLTSILILLFCWGCNIVYVITMEDILGKIFDFSGVPSVFMGIWGKRLLVTIFFCVFMFPLSLMKQINSLRYASMVGVCSSLYLVFSVMAHSISDKSKITTVPVAKFDSAMISSIPVFIFAYCCQVNCFEVYAELKTKTPNRMTFYALVSMVACTVVYLFCGYFGASNFGALVDGNILNNLSPREKVYIFIAFITIAFTITMAFPIAVFPTRDTILQFVGYKNVYVTPTKVRLLVASCISISALIIGFFVPGIQIMFSLLGGICGSTLSFIWPALFALRTGKWTVSEVGYGNVIFTWILLIFGVLAAIFGTALSIYQQVVG